MTDPVVQYTLREMFDRIDQRLDSIDDRLESLEKSRNRSSAITALGGKAWIGAIAVIGILVNIPAAMFYLGAR